MDLSCESRLSQLFTALKNKNTEEIRYFLGKLRGYVNNKGPDADGCTALHEAAKLGDANILQLFVDHKRINVNVQDNNGSTPLHYVIERNENLEEACKVLIEAGADIVASNKNGKTPLHVLIEKQVNLKIIESLINMKNRKGKTVSKIALSEAVCAGNVEITQLLIDYGCYINKTLTTLLHQTAKSNVGESHFEVAKVLLKTGLDDVNVQDCIKNTALHYLTKKADTIKMIELFLKYEAQVNIKNEKGEISLFNAITAGNLDVVKLLIDHGSDVKSVSNDGSTALHKVASCINGNSQFQIAELLLRNGADVNVKDINGLAPLHMVCDQEETVQLLLNFGADVNITDNRGKIPLFTAVRCRNNKIVQLLLDHGSDINNADKDGLTALLQATKISENDDNLSIVEILLKNGANVNSQDEYGKTPLHHLLSNENNANTIKLVLDYKPYVNIKDNYSKIPLFCAIMNNYNVDVIQLLLDHGSDVNSIIVNHYNWTPLHTVAARYEYSAKIVKCLLKNGADANALDSKGRTSLRILLQSSSPFSYDVDKTLQFLFKYLNINEIDQTEKELLSSIKIEEKWKMVLKHVAKLQALELPTNPAFEKSISNKLEYRDYFVKCFEELTLAKNTKLKNCWVTFFNLLIDNRRQLKNYAGNFDLIEDFEKSDCIRKFPIYGSEMQKNLEKGKRRRKLFDKSSGMLSNDWPIFGPSHLIIRDLLDCLPTKDLTKFCNEM